MTKARSIPDPCFYYIFVATIIWTMHLYFSSGLRVSVLSVACNNNFLQNLNIPEILGARGGWINDLSQTLFLQTFIQHVCLRFCSLVLEIV